jgi:hypothetical protein
MESNQSSPAPLHLLVGPVLDGEIAKYQSKAKSAIKPTGWMFTKIYFNAETGYLKVQLKAPETKSTVRLLTIHRANYQAPARTMREIVDVKPSLYIGDWLDTCGSTLIGRDSFPHIGAAMLSCAIYISDNPAPGHVAVCAKAAMRAIAGMAVECECLPPNDQANRAAGEDQ